MIRYFLLLSLFPHILHRTHAVGGTKLLNVVCTFQLDLNPTFPDVPHLARGLEILENETETRLRNRFDSVDEVEVESFTLNNLSGACDPVSPAFMNGDCTLATALAGLTINSTVNISGYERATTTEVQSFVKYFNEERHPNVMFVSYLGPIYVWTTITLLFEWPISDLRRLTEAVSSASRQVMNENEKTILTEALLQVVDEVGTASTTEARVFAQLLKAANENLSQEQLFDSNLVRILVQGICQTGCNQESFSRMYNKAFDENVDLFMERVKQIADGDTKGMTVPTTPTEYFEEATVTRVTPPEEEEVAVADVKNFDDTVEEGDFPWWIIGAAAGVVILVGGAIGCGVYQKSRRTVDDAGKVAARSLEQPAVEKDIIAQNPIYDSDPVPVEEEEAACLEKKGLGDRLSL